MLAFLRRNQVLLASGFFLSLSLALLSWNRGRGERVDPVGRVLLEVVKPLQIAYEAIADRATRVWSSYVALVAVGEENRRLRELVRALEGERHRLKEFELENERFRELLGIRREIQGNAITARIIGKDASSWFRTFVLDRGEEDGIIPGMAVVHTQGVVGRVIQASQRASRVLLVTDHNSGVDAIVQRSRAQGIVEGILDGGCRLKYVRRADDVEPGDLVITSGLDGIFPKGILIGRVANVAAADDGLFRSAEVEPAVDFETLEEVLVVTSSRRPDVPKPQEPAK